MVYKIKQNTLIKKIYKDIGRKFDKVIYINIQNFSINGCAIYQNRKCFFKITDEEYFIKEINGYLISYKEIPTMTILFVKHLSQCKKYLIAYNFNNKIKENSGLLNDILVKNDKINIMDKSVDSELKKILNVYNTIYSGKKVFRSYCPSNIFFVERIYSRLDKWYMSCSDFKRLVILNGNYKFNLQKILEETKDYFLNNENKKQQCILCQGDPNTLNISTTPCFFDLATAGYNPIIGELAITIISTLIYDNYFCPKYHSKSYYLHELAIEQSSLFEPNLYYKYDKSNIYIESNIRTSNIRKRYIFGYLEILKKNNIHIGKEIKYYIIMRLLCVFNIRKMLKKDYYYSLYLVCYFYKNIGDDFYRSISDIINEMECV